MSLKIKCGESYDLVRELLYGKTNLTGILAPTQVPAANKLLWYGEKKRLLDSWADAWLESFILMDETLNEGNNTDG